MWVVLMKNTALKLKDLYKEQRENNRTVCENGIKKKKIKYRTSGKRLQCVNTVHENDILSDAETNCKISYTSSFTAVVTELKQQNRVIVVLELHQDLDYKCHH